ncbi:MAG: metallophosphoesterase [bacterium]
MLIVRLESKIFQIFSVLVFCLSLSVVQAMQQDGVQQFIEPKMPTLTEWTSRCFAELPEYTEEYKTVLTSLDFLYVIKKCRNMYQETAFGNKENWRDGAAPDNGFFEDVASEESFFSVWDCAQKYKAPVGSTPVFIGDIHGCVHALLRDLWGLVADKKLDNNFKLAPGVTIVCLGDYIDRGKYSAEVLYTLCLLKMANFDQVFLLRGNHETFGYFDGPSGFGDELKNKFKLEEDQLNFVFNFILKLVRCFPLVLFFESGDSVIQCSHGGICSGYDPVDLLHAPDTKIFERIKPVGASANSEQFSAEMKKNKNWAGHFFGVDFTGKDYKDGVVLGSRGLVYGRNGVNEYRERINKSLKEAGLKLRLEGFFRGHEHACFGLKMLETKNGERGAGALQANLWQMHWKQIVSLEEIVNTEILIHKYYPVFTFSTASGTPLCGQPYDCYGVLTTAQKWEDWKLKVYEGKTPLNENFKVEREKIDGKVIEKSIFKNEKYVEIDTKDGFVFSNQCSGMAIDVRWVDKKDKRTPIGDALIKFVQELKYPSEVIEKEEKHQDKIEIVLELDESGNKNSRSKRKREETKEKEDGRECDSGQSFSKRAKKE